MSTLSPASNAAVHPDLQKVVDEGRLTAAAARNLSQLEPGAFTQHKSWGFGQVASWKLDDNQILIDFGPKKGHPMQLQYAGDNLKPLPADHLLSRKSADLPGVKKQASEDPAALLRSVLLYSDQHRATPTQLAALLVPEVVSGEAEFKRWWESAKKQLKKDGRFVIPAKKTDFVEMRDEALDHNAQILSRFAQARQLKTQLAVLDDITKNIEDFKAKPDGLEEVLAAAGASAVRNQRLDIDAAFELLVTRDEIANATGIALPSDAPLLTTMMRDEENRLGEIIGNLPAAKQRFALFQMPAALGDDKWAARALSLLPQTHNARVVGEVARLFDSQNRTEEMRTFLDRSIRDYSVTCEMLLWMCKERDNEKYADFASPRLFKAILSALERDGLSDIKRSTRLHDLLSGDRALVTELLQHADHAELRSAARALLATPALEELDKRSLMARLMKLHPDLQNLLTGGGEEKPQALIVSWSSLERRKLEFDDLVNKQIPKNIEEISIARSYGDLRENFEFKAAKEMQSVLARRRAETERDLSRAQGTNFENPDTNVVSIGTVVTLKEEGGKGKGKETYTILGAWDGNPEKAILSYLTAIAQALIGHKVGDVIALPTENGTDTRQVIIESIKAYQMPKASA